MIKSIISTKIKGKKYLIGSEFLIDDDWHKVEKIELDRHWTGRTYSEVFTVYFDSGYEIVAPYDDYEMLFKKEAEE